MSHQPLRIIGLTGGIACGKSTVSDYLSQHHSLSILDADLLAREAVLPPSSILQRLVNRYGDQILESNRYLNRRRLGEIIFQNPHERLWVESQIHPFVRDRLQQLTATHLQQHRDQTTVSPIVMVIPLLFEAKMDDLVTEIWVVSCSESQQIERLIRRNRLSPAEAQQRIESQMSLPLKVLKADVVLDNQASLSSLYEKIDRALLGKSVN